MQVLLQVQQLFPVPLQQLRHRDAGPAIDHFGDLLIRNLVAQQLMTHGFGGGGEAPLQFGNAAVLQFRHPRQVAAAPRRLQGHAGRLQLLLDVLGAAQAGLLRLPDLIQVRILPLQALGAAPQVLKAALAGLVALLLQRLDFHLLLNEAALQPVHDLRLGVDLHADAAGRLVDQVDGLVRQLPAGDVAMRETGGGDDGRVRDIDPVVQLVALLEAAQDGNAVRDARLVDQHLLEAPLQGGVLFDVLAVFVQGGGTHAVQVPSRQGRLQHVAGVHGPFGLAGTDHGVQLIDEEDDVALLLGEFVQHRLEALLELAAELGAGDQGAHVQGEDALALETLRHLAVEDALRQAFDDSGLAHSGFADQHRVVLGAALQHLDGAADFVIAPDYRVQLALLRPFGEVDAVLGQRLPLLLRIGALHGFAAAHRFNGAFQLAEIDSSVTEHPLDRSVLGQRPQHLLAGQVLVAGLLR